MVTVQDPITTPGSSSDLVGWVDHATSGGAELPALIHSLTALTLPGSGSAAEAVVNPLLGDLDDQLWFWNRAANNLAARSRFDDAVQVWSAQYLALLSLQLKARQRYPKGTALCNIGYALARSGRRSPAIKGWIFGVVEDALMGGGSVEDEENYRNLLKVHVAPSLLDPLIATVESRFLGQSITPLFPEMVVDFWLNPAATLASGPWSAAMESLSRRLADDYPALPDVGNPWDQLLRPFWDVHPGFEDISRGH